MEKPLLTAKVYRPCKFRNLKKIIFTERDAFSWRGGKVILDDHSLHAMNNRSSYGLELLHTSWVGHEFLTLKILSEAGVDIPKPYASGNNAILMDYIGDVHNAAPTLNTVTLSVTEARALYQRVIHNIDLMLQCNRIHADLSAYNILYWDGAISLIDFPQAINPEENHNAYRIFARDVQRVCEYFASQGVKNDPVILAEKLWKSRGRKTIPEIDPHYLDPEKPEDRQVWEKRN